MTRAGKARQFEALRPALWGGPRGLLTARSPPSWVLTEEAARAAAHRLRRRYRELLREEVARTVDDPAEVDEEIRSLFALARRLTTRTWHPGRQRIGADGLLVRLTSSRFPGRPLDASTRTLPGMRSRIARGCSRRALSELPDGRGHRRATNDPGARVRRRRRLIWRRFSDRRPPVADAGPAGDACGSRPIPARDPGAGADPGRGVRAVRGRGAGRRAGAGQGVGARRQADAVSGRGVVAGQGAGAGHRQLLHPRQAGRRRHGGRLQGQASPARPGRRAQDPAAVAGARHRTCSCGSAARSMSPPG